MNRALRRHPVATKPPKRTRLAPAPRPPRPTPKPRAGPWWRRFWPQWLEDIVAELKKVVWPTRQETAYLTMVVVVVSLVVGLFLGGIDLGFAWIMEHTILR